MMRHFERLIDQCTYREFFMAAIDHPNKKKNTDTKSPPSWTPLRHLPSDPTEIP